MVIEFVYSYLATVFFAYMFNSPQKAIYVSGLIGAIGWVIYSFLYKTYGLTILGSFLSALTVAFLCEIAARRFKMPVTVYLTSGIIPLVPGAGLYNTMLELVQNSYGQAAIVGTQTLFIAGSISIAIIISSSIFKKIPA